MSASLELIKRSHVLQLDQRDCGVACLLSLVRFYGGDSNFEQIRRFSGADLSGTSLLGLKEAALQLGFEADGYESDISSLIEHGKPVILHIELEGGLQHYVIYYPHPSLPPAGEGAIHLISDPAHGIVEWSMEELKTHWKSGACLVLEPKETFVKVNEKANLKKEWFWNLIRQDVPLLAVSAGVGVVMAALGLAMAIYSQQLIDKILPSKNVTRIVVATVLVVILLLARVGLSVLRQLLLLRQSKEFGIRINTSFYDKLLYLPKSFFDTRRIGDFVARLNDSSRIQSTVSMLTGNLLVDLLMVFASFGLLFYYNWPVGLASVLILPLYFWLIYRQNKGLIEAQTNVMVAYSHSEGNFINTIQGIADVKNRNKQSFFSNINKLLFGHFQEQVYRSGTKQVFLAASTGVASVAFIALVLTLTIRAVYENQIKIGEMTAILGAVSSLLPSVTNLALISVPLNDAKIAFERMYEFVQVIPEKITQAEETFTFQSLHAQNISFRFPGKTQQLQDITFHLNKGEVISIVGESGGGKSLICQLIQRFYEPEAGMLLINGQMSLQEMDVQHWRSLIGIVPQQVHIFNGTVIDNICFGTTEQEIIKAFQLLAGYGFAPFLESFPQGVLTVLGEEGVNLSGGQRQLIGLARALVPKPQLLILDEATAALDRNTERFVLNLLGQLKKEMAILFISHRLHTLRSICDHIYLLENGILTQSGTHEQLMQYANSYSDYWQEWEPASL
ncbi:peptidase domain-containing ABC transporter [Runella sp.]|uniref:peptidase domain-containing ABC transporter n=1 Tax=Runella sp. TaxID=1960881 RepID=UPI003D12170F